MLSKTRRRPVDVSGSEPLPSSVSGHPGHPGHPGHSGHSGHPANPGSISDRSDQFIQFLATNAEDAFTRPWHRLERGRRLNRIRKFVEEEAQRFQFSETEQTAMFQMLEKMLDKKQLNSKSIVTYDTEQQKILEVKGLVFHKQADGSIVFKITERKANTVRKSKAPSSKAVGVTTLAQEPKQDPPSTQ